MVKMDEVTKILIKWWLESLFAFKDNAYSDVPKVLSGKHRGLKLFSLTLDHPCSRKLRGSSFILLFKHLYLLNKVQSLLCYGNWGTVG